MPTHRNPAPKSTQGTADDWLTIAGGAEWLKCAPATIRRMIADGDIPAYRFSDRMIRIKRSDIVKAGRRVESLAVG